MAELLAYYLDTKAFEVHLASCPTVSASPQYQHLGRYWNCSSAVHEAMRHVPKTELSKVNGCVHCCRDCHTS